MGYQFNNNIPIYIQIIESIKSDIVRGKYTCGEKLPSVRELSVIFGANPNTVQKSLAELESIGLITTDRTNGKFVTKDVSKIDEIRRLNVKKVVDEFVANLQSLGVKKEEITDIVKQECDL